VNDLVNADAVSAADFDALIIPGGFAPDYMAAQPGCPQLGAATALNRERLWPHLAMPDGSWLRRASWKREDDDLASFPIKDD